MQRIVHFSLALALLILVSAAGGCTVYDVAVEERNVGDWANDENITFAIKQQFLKDDLIKYMDFDAASYEGRVYLLGEYESHSQTERAVSIAKSVKGVRSVTTYFLPKRAQDYCGTTDNLELYGRVKQKLVADTNVWSTNINIKTIQCNVVLLGIVGSAAQKNAAIAHAKSVPGVRSVKSYLTVK